MILEDFAIICVNNNRTRAYLQMMKRHNYQPDFCYIMVKDKESLLEESYKFSRENISENNGYFNDNEPIIYTIETMNIPYEIYEVENINNIEIVSILKSSKYQYFIYSGYSGQILGKEVLDTGKLFLHIHPGIVPKFRGSTTIYYSLLKEGICGASAFILDSKIDTGPILHQRVFEIPENPPSIDHIFDPYIRAEVLIDVLKSYKENHKFIPISQDSDNEGETYFIIHPVLKHIALLSEVETKRSKNK